MLHDLVRTYAFVPHCAALLSPEAKVVVPRRHAVHHDAASMYTYSTHTTVLVNQQEDRGRYPNAHESSLSQLIVSLSKVTVIPMDTYRPRQPSGGGDEGFSMIREWYAFLPP